MAKTWEKTVMSDEQISKVFEKRYPEISPFAPDNVTPCYRDVAQAQAEITGWMAYQEGIRKVVEWADEWCPHRDNDFPSPDYVPDELRLHKRDCPDCWQAFKKEIGG